jgi:hypothetical protein
VPFPRIHVAGARLAALAVAAGLHILGWPLAIIVSAAITHSFSRT